MSPLRPRASRPRMAGYGLLPPDEGRGLLPWTWAEERFAASRNYWVSSVRPDGAPHSMPVWGVWLGDDFGFSTGAGSRKARNLSVEPRCVVSSEKADEAVIVEGVAQRSDDPAWLERFATVYERKYDWKVDESLGPIYRVRPTVAFAFIEAAEDFLGSATRWSFAEDPPAR